VPTLKTYTRQELETSWAKIDFALINSLSEEELEARAKADPDYWEPSNEDLDLALKSRDERLKKARAS
jgi:hypothetical protein